jgi:hypothetical protein
MEEKEKGVAAVEATVEVDTKVAEVEEKLAKMTEERDNYKKGLLQAKGKLPSEELDVSELSVAEQVELALKNRDIEQSLQAKEVEVQRILRENSELKLALKNRPEGSIGGGSDGASVEVKDNVFSAEQIAELTKKANMLKVDPVKFIERTKKNLQSRS